MYSRPSAFGPPSLMSASNAIYSGSRGEGVYDSVITDPNNALLLETDQTWEKIILLLLHTTTDRLGQILNLLLLLMVLIVLKIY